MKETPAKDSASVKKCKIASGTTILLAVNVALSSLMTMLMSDLAILVTGSEIEEKIISAVTTSKSVVSIEDVNQIRGRFFSLKVGIKFDAFLDQALCCLSLTNSENLARRKKQLAGLRVGSLSDFEVDKYRSYLGHYFLHRWFH